MFAEPQRCFSWVRTAHMRIGPRESPFGAGKLTVALVSRRSPERGDLSGRPSSVSSASRAQGGAGFTCPGDSNRSPSALTVGIQISFSQMSAGQKVTLALLWSSSQSLSTSPTSLDIFLRLTPSQYRSVSSLWSLSHSFYLVLFISHHKLSKIICIYWKQMLEVISVTLMLSF